MGSFGFTNALMIVKQKQLSVIGPHSFKNNKGNKSHMLGGSKIKKIKRLKKTGYFQSIIISKNLKTSILIYQVIVNSTKPFRFPLPSQVLHLI